MATAAEKPSSKGQAWFCNSTGLPSDIVIEVDEMTFHLHKFPLMSKSRKLHNLITESEEHPTSFSNKHVQNTSEPEPREEEFEEIEEYVCHQVLSDFPGGSVTFELVAKFCYGVKIELTSSNVAPLRCAGEFLEMTEEYSEENIISMTEMYLSQSVLQSIKESIKALKSCQLIMPLAETLSITQRCIEAIASRASSSDPTLFGWPVSGQAEGVIRDFAKQILSNEIDIDGPGRRKSVSRAKNAESWFEDLALLSLPLFKRLISAIEDKDLSSDITESCLIYYAKKHIPGVSRSNRKPSSSSLFSSETEKKELLETVISHLPLEKSSRTPTATRFLFGLLRTANILNASDACKAAMEKKIGLQLDQATLDDLLIPSYSYLNETLYDVDCVERILSYFLDRFHHRNTTGIEDDQHADDSSRSPALMLVGKMIDGYLSEIASDAKLKPDKFYNLAISLSAEARLFDDGLYRSLDAYLMAHPWISEADREKICGVIDCQKLTLEACTHAAQNERLPLRAIVQVLFFEQVQLRNAVSGTLLKAENDAAAAGRLSAVSHERGTGTGAVRENQVLRLDMDSMRTRVDQLERECSTMKKAIEKIEKAGRQESGESGRAGSLMKRFGCKLRTQVCDSQESTVVHGRKGRRQHRQQ